MWMSCLCCTWHRPRLLEEAIESFIRQDYPASQCELIVLDDGGLYEDSELPGNVKVVSFRSRFRTLGQKRNAAAALADRRAESFVVWDDDDIYLPHCLESHAKALACADVSVPEWVLVDSGHRMERKRNRFMFHGGWAYKLSVFESAGSYPSISNGEDQALMAKWRALEASIASPDCENPFYVYRWGGSGSPHLSAVGDQERLPTCSIQTPIRLSPHWSKDYIQIAKEAVNSGL